jgi:hypothetical protein
MQQAIIDGGHPWEEHYSGKLEPEFALGSTLGLDDLINAQIHEAFILVLSLFAAGFLGKQLSTHSSV